MSHVIDMSVIVPTRDSAANLDRCLESARTQSAVTVELIVVDQMSGDATREIAVRHGATVISLPPRELYAPPTQSRNLGASRAHGEYLVHLDSDMALEEGALVAARELCRWEGHIAAILEESDIGAGYWFACKALERTAYRNTPLEAARFVRADVFRAVGGYDEALGSGEDWDVHARYARCGSIGRLPNSVRHHVGRVTFTGQARKKFHYGRSAGAFVAKKQSRPLPSAMIRAYGRSWRLFAGDPWHLLGVVVLRLCEAGALAAGLAFEDARQRTRRRLGDV